MVVGVLVEYITPRSPYWRGIDPGPTAGSESSATETSMRQRRIRGYLTNFKMSTFQSVALLYRPAPYNLFWCDIPSTLWWRTSCTLYSLLRSIHSLLLHFSDANIIWNSWKLFSCPTSLYTLSYTGAPHGYFCTLRLKNTDRPQNDHKSPSNLNTDTHDLWYCQYLPNPITEEKSFSKSKKKKTFHIPSPSLQLAWRYSAEP